MRSLTNEEKSTPIIGKRYKLIAQLGVGGFGQSFLAQDLHLPGCPRCVVKRLLVKTHDVKHLKTARRLFDTEARVLYQLGRHDQIPSLYAHFEENQEFYLVQEFIEGQSLTRQIAKGKPWPEERVIILLRDILEILTFVHQQNVIHRDVKPSNLIRRHQDGKLVLIDFGAVKQVSVQLADLDSDVAESTIVVGTHGYIPNEQLAGKPRFCSDVYAVGIVGIQALTGVAPKLLGEVAETGELEWRSHVPGVSPELADVIDRMVYYDFRDRYPTAMETLEALKNLPTKLFSFADTDVDLPFWESEESDATVHFKSDLFETALTQKESDIINHHGSDQPKPTLHQEETLTFGDASPNRSEGGPFRTVPSANPSWKQRLQSGWQGGWLKRWSVPMAVLAIAGIAFLSTKLNSGLKPTAETLPSLNSAVKGSPPVKAVPPATVPSPSSLLLTETPLNRANRLLKQRQYSEALAAFNQAIELNPNKAEAYWGRCESLNGLKQPDSAIVACNDALNLNPDYAEALWSKGKAYRQQDRILEALHLFKEATLVKPTLAGAWVDRGSVLQEVGRSEEAINALDEAIALNRNLAEAWSIRGSALWNLGRYDQAIASLDKALEIQPSAKDARAMREKARKELGY
ncbi:protein kinase domain-containing protein [Leptodesmis sichuanensis]|uniref:serine/threonine-protein kinase n=1 Tax=Leptodesmis sichuanensis TaxID=2906798 RepID=UPI001F212E60|nr:serine/threonine-protein kinase [Leptodesmis sichuanensis]UIE39546.1 tetratricopeptide repeat protein [Leptodesmis sichuanensis A121]